MLALIYMALFLCGLTFFLVHRRIYTWFAPQVEARAGELLYTGIEPYSWRFFQNTLVGSLIAKINRATTASPEIISMFSFQYLSLSVFAVITIATIAHISGFMALVLIVFILLLISVSYHDIKRAIPLQKVSTEAGAEVIGQISDTLSNMMTVELFVQRAYELARFRSFNMAYTHTREISERAFSALRLKIRCAIVLYTFFFITVLLWLFKKGRVTPGDFVFVFMSGTIMFERLMMAIAQFPIFLRFLEHVRAGIALLDLPVEVSDAPNAATLDVPRGEIVFSDVTFGYGEKNVITDLSITFRPGQKTGIVGYSGGGKTTLMSLLLRLYDVRAGEILIDGTDIASVTQDSLRQAIAVIPEDSTLFHRTLRENIRYGRQDATDDQVITASKQACMHEFVMTLPEGYETVVGERGMKLSGGQRQRIAIARALLKNAPILVMDEATSQLDSVTEHAIQDVLSRWGTKQTMIVIAHRLSTLLHMDRILVMEHGRIVEEGAHTELLTRNGRYKALWDAQVNGFLVDRPQHSP